MVILPWILVVVLAVLFLAMTYVAYRFYRKAVVYDEVFQYLADDIYINLRQFAKMMTSNVMSNEPEIVDAHQKMTVMAKRLNEILTRMEEASGLQLRPAPRQPAPKVV